MPIHPTVPIGILNVIRAAEEFCCGLVRTKLFVSTNAGRVVTGTGAVVATAETVAGAPAATAATGVAAGPVVAVTMGATWGMGATGATGATLGSTGFKEIFGETCGVSERV